MRAIDALLAPRIGLAPLLHRVPFLSSIDHIAEALPGFERALRAAPLADTVPPGKPRMDAHGWLSRLDETSWRLTIGC